MSTQVVTTIAPSRNQKFVVITLALFVLGAIYLTNSISGRHGLQYLLGGVLGVALYHAHYGFTSSYRIFLTEKRGVGLRAQMILFFLTNLIFLPFFINGQAFGHTIVGNVSPVGISLLVGAFLFGIGMQMGDGCASGTLYHIGGGDARGIITLIGFVAGSVIGTAHFTWWTNTPHLNPISFIACFGFLGGFLFNICLMAVVYGITVFIERRRYGSIQTIFHNAPLTLNRVIRGPWSWMMGTVVIMIGSLGILLVSGKPWGVTSSFALWGAKISLAFGMPIENWDYWKSAANNKALHSSVFQDMTTLSDIGLMLGAFLALVLSNAKVSFSLRQYPPRMIVGLLAGGILMGYGARLAFGCNIGAYFSGIASFSLHGWIWFVMAMLGSYVGVKVRRYCAFTR